MATSDHTAEPIDTPEEMQAFLETTLSAQAKLWPLTLEKTQDPTPPPIQAFVAGAINQVLDAHLYRLATLSVPVAAFTQAMVLAATVTAVFLLGNRSACLVVRSPAAPSRSHSFSARSCLRSSTSGGAMRA